MSLGVRSPGICGSLVIPRFAASMRPERRSPTRAALTSARFDQRTTSRSDPCAFAAEIAARSPLALFARDRLREHAIERGVPRVRRADRRLRELQPRPGGAPGARRPTGTPRAPSARGASPRGACRRRTRARRSAALRTPRAIRTSRSSPGRARAATVCPFLAWSDGVGKLRISQASATDCRTSCATAPVRPGAGRRASARSCWNGTSAIRDAEDGRGRRARRSPSAPGRDRACRMCDRQALADERPRDLREHGRAGSRCRSATSRRRACAPSATRASTRAPRAVERRACEGTARRARA